MRQFRVWAPSAKSVVLREEDSSQQWPLSRGDGGWFETTVDEARDGFQYRYVLDDGEALPDPRSPYQPHGIAGPSQVVEHDRFVWSDHLWRGINLSSAVIYELHIGTFTPEGTFAAAIERLDHLVDIGITAVELLPVAEFPGERGWGYDGVDLYAPHSAYGGPEGLQKLVDSCHAKGLGVILDVVYNHLGPDGNHLGAYGPYFTDRYSTPWGQAVNYDGPGSDGTRAFVIDNALMWLRDYHIDGLRLDAVHAIFDFSARHVLSELAERIEDLGAHLGRTLFLVAESDLDDPRIVARREVGGYGMDAQWSDDFHHALHAALTGETDGYYADFGSLESLADTLENVFHRAGEFSGHRERRFGASPVGIPKWRFLAYLQNHDQIGNRAMGERAGALLSPGRLKVGAALVLLSPYVPMLFQGEEWAASTPFQYFTDHQNAELGKAVSEGRRREFAAFGWDPASVPDPQDEATFTRSKLNWNELRELEHAEILEWHRQLLQLRRSEPSLSAGNGSVDVDIDGQTIAVWRSEFGLLINLETQSRTLEVGSAELLLASEEAVTADEKGVLLPPDSVAVVRRG